MLYANGMTIPREQADIRLVNGDYERLSIDVSRYSPEDQKYIAHRLIALKQGWAVAYKLEEYSYEKVSSLDAEIAVGLIVGGYGEFIAPGIKYFPESDHNAIAIFLTENGYVNDVKKYIEGFKNLTAELADHLMQKREFSFVINNMNIFDKLDQMSVVESAIDAGVGFEAAVGIENFDAKYHGEIARRLIVAGNGLSVLKNIEKFEGLDHKDIVRQLIEANSGSLVFDYAHKLDGVSIDNEDIGENGKAMRTIIIEPSTFGGVPEKFSYPRLVASHQSPRPSSIDANRLSTFELNDTEGTSGHHIPNSPNTKRSFADPEGPPSQLPDNRPKNPPHDPSMVIPEKPHHQPWSDGGESTVATQEIPHTTQPPATTPPTTLATTPHQPGL